MSDAFADPPHQASLRTGARPGAVGLAGEGPGQPRLGRLLLDRGQVAPGALAAALAAQRVSGARLGDALRARGLAPTAALARALADQRGLPVIDPGADPPDPALIAAARLDAMAGWRAMPWRADPPEAPGRVLLVTPEPDRAAPDGDLSAVAAALGLPPGAVPALAICSPEAWETAWLALPPDRRAARAARRTPEALSARRLGDRATRVGFALTFAGMGGAAALWPAPVLDTLFLAALALNAVNVGLRVAALCLRKPTPPQRGRMAPATWLAAASETATTRRDAPAPPRSDAERGPQAGAPPDPWKGRFRQTGASPAPARRASPLPPEAPPTPDPWKGRFRAPGGSVAQPPRPADAPAPPGFAEAPAPGFARPAPAPSPRSAAQLDALRRRLGGGALRAASVRPPGQGGAGAQPLSGPAPMRRAEPAPTPTPAPVPSSASPFRRPSGPALFPHPAPPSPPAPPAAILPMVTIMAPLHREPAAAPGLIAALRAIDYPPERLEALIAIEHDDHATAAAIRAADPPPWLRIIPAPPGGPRTKPRAMNHALDLARGEIVGIYDAEDRPDPGQIRRAAAIFAKAPPRLACLQARLAFHNTADGWLPRCFAIEYIQWFHLVLPAMRRMGFPIPLGGTSLFFRRRALERLGAWDAWNVTEDADLGLRLARAGYETGLVDSDTQEEAVSRPLAWIRQRSRWQKGYLHTWMTHMRRPVRLWRELGAVGFLGFQAHFVGAASAFLGQPLLWSAWFFWGFYAEGFQATGLPPGLIVALLAALHLGQLAMLAGALEGLRRAGRLDLAWWTLTLPFYWPLATLSAIKSLIEAVAAPMWWDKTEHGAGLPVTPLSSPPRRSRRSWGARRPRRVAEAAGR